MNIVLAPDGPLHAGATLARYHLWGEDPANRLADGALLRVLRYQGRLVPYAVRATGPVDDARLAMRIPGVRDASTGEAGAAEGRRVFGPHFDLSGLHPGGAGGPRLPPPGGPLLRAGGGAERGRDRAADATARVRPLDRGLVPRPLSRARRRLRGGRPRGAPGLRALLRPWADAQRGGDPPPGARVGRVPEPRRPLLARGDAPRAARGGRRMTTKVGLRILGQPDPNVPKDVHLVGRYALGVDWADNHGSIYPFDRLRRDCACGACAALDSLTQAMAWPQEIKRTDDGLRVTWGDAHVSLYPYPALRGLCRCASCTGGH